mgnify:CR=1 FL=1
MRSRRSSASTLADYESIIDLCQQALGAVFFEGELDGLASLDEEVEDLWQLGIRQVTPIHGIDNRLGSQTESALNLALHVLGEQRGRLRELIDRANSKGARIERLP